VIHIFEFLFCIYLKYLLCALINISRIYFNGAGKSSEIRSKNHFGDTQMSDSAKARDFKAEYEDAIKSAGLYHAGATNNGERVLNRLLSATVPSSAAALNKEIAEAAAKNEEDKLEELFKKRKALKDAESANLKSLATIRQSTPFEKILIAYKPEVEALAYELALEVLKGTHVALNNATPAKRAKSGGAPSDENKKPAAAAKEAHIEGPDGQTFVVPFHKGPPTLKGLGELLKALGFNVEETPKGPKTEETIKPKEGGEMLVTRRNIVDAIKSGLYKGFTVTKDETDEQKPA
jgi:hypothetical protein